MFYDQIELKSNQEAIKEAIDCRHSIPIDVTTDPADEYLSKAYGRILLNTYFDGKEVDLKTDTEFQKFLLVSYRKFYSRIPHSIVILFSTEC